MRKLFLALLFVTGCTTATIKLDGIDHAPPKETSPAPEKITKRLDTEFAARLREMVVPKMLKAASIGCPAPVMEASSYNGIKFRFAAPTVCVKSVLGEPICRAPFQVTSIEPAYVVEAGVSRNGYMFNIPNQASGQSFDSRAFEVFRAPPSLPVSFTKAGDALVAVRSKPVGYPPGQYFDGQTENQAIETAAVLTADTEARVCNAPPFFNHTTLFRRAPFGDKTLAYKVEDFLGVLPIPTIPVWPGISSGLHNYYSGSVGMQAWENWGVHGHIPADKLMSYGNYRAARQGERMMVALMDIPFEQRLIILMSLAQDAIDAGAAHLGGAVYPANGGHNSGPHLAMVKWLGWLTGDDRFKQKGPITTKRFGEQFHLEWGSNFYVPSHTVNYNAFFDGAWQTEPSPASKPVSQYNDSDKRKISYMLCCGALNWQAGYLALNILGQLDPVASETDRIVMRWIKQFREPYSVAWNNALVSVNASSMIGWWGGGQPVANYYWPYFGW